MKTLPIPAVAPVPTPVVDLSHQTLIKDGTRHLPYPIYTGIPTACTLWKMPSEGMSPFAERGDIVVVDCADRAVEFGEYFLISQSQGPWIWQFLRSKRPSERPTVNLRIASHDFQQFGPGRGYFSDGDIYQDALEQMIIGRVIGIYRREIRG